MAKWDFWIYIFALSAMHMLYLLHQHDEPSGRFGSVQHKDIVVSKVISLPQ